jgi:ABC-type phosphate transport system substrate-binding protein
MVRKLTQLAIATLLVVVSNVPDLGGAADGYQVIVHSSNPATSLAREQVARYFLKKATAWPAGKSVTAVDMDKDSATRAAFSQDVLHKSVAEVTSYWQQQIFSGRAVPPVVKKSDAEVVAFVEGSEGAIGYVSAGADTGAAKVVRVVE